MDGIFLAVERARLQKRLVHLLRYGAVFYDRAVRGDVAAQNGNGAVRADGIIERADDIRALETGFI